MAVQCTFLVMIAPQFATGESKIQNAQKAITLTESTVNVTINSTNIGTVTGPNIDCGTYCSETYANGTVISLKAVPKAYWKFAYWDNGETVNSSNPMVFKVKGNVTWAARFLPTDRINKLRAIDSNPLGTRTPVILVHGNNGENSSDSYCDWARFINNAKANATFMGKYKMYLYRWHTPHSNLYNGLALGVLLDEVKGLRNKNVLFVAHSRGGLIARYYMNRYQPIQGNFKGNPAGEKVQYLVTLATPHRGSPGADRYWVDFTINNYLGTLAAPLSNVYINNVWNRGYLYLLWDDVNGILTNDTVCCWDSFVYGDDFSSKLDSNKTDLAKLNKQEKYLKKIIAYGGNIFNPKYDLKDILDIIVSGNGSEHYALIATSVLMATVPIIPNGYPENPIKRFPFKAGDGMVPLFSSLFLKPGGLNIFTVDDSGSAQYDSNKLAQYTQIKEVNIWKSDTDHLNFIDNDSKIKAVIKRLNNL